MNRPFPSVEWGPSQVMHYTVFRILASKLLLQEDYEFFKHAESRNRTDDSPSAFWTVPAGCLATVGAFVSLESQNVLPSLLSMVPTVYGLCHNHLSSLQKSNVEKALNLLCVAQTALFGAMECVVSNLTLEVMGDHGLVRTLPHREDINKIIHTLYGLLLDINANYNMNQPSPSGLQPLAGRKFTLNDVEETKRAYKCMRELSNFYSGMVSKLLLDFILTLAVDEYDPTNSERPLITTKRIPDLIKLIEERVLALASSFRHLQYRTKHPIDDSMTCLYESVEWYNERLDTLSALSYNAAQINAVSRIFNTKITDVVQDLAKIKTTLTQEIDNLAECQTLIRHNYYEAERAFRERVHKDKELRDEARDQIRCLLKELTEYRSKNPSTRTVHLEQTRASTSQYILEGRKSKILPSSKSQTLSSNTMKPLVTTTNQTVPTPRIHNETVVKGTASLATTTTINVDIKPLSHETVVKYAVFPVPEKKNPMKIEKSSVQKNTLTSVTCPNHYKNMPTLEMTKTIHIAIGESSSSKTRSTKKDTSMERKGSSIDDDKSSSYGPNSRKKDLGERSTRKTRSTQTDTSMECKGTSMDDDKSSSYGPNGKKKGIGERSTRKTLSTKTDTSVQCKGTSIDDDKVTT